MHKQLPAGLGPWQHSAEGAKFLDREVVATEPCARFWSYYGVQHLFRWDLSGLRLRELPESSGSLAITDCLLLPCRLHNISLENLPSTFDEVIVGQDLTLFGNPVRGSFDMSNG